VAGLTGDEVVPGLVVQIDADSLRATGRVETNAEVVGLQDRAVRGEHSFLVLRVDARVQTVLMTPIFSMCATGSEILDESLKGGYPVSWIGVTLHFNRWQHWKVPIADLIVHSGAEDTPAGSRRAYAKGHVAELERIASFCEVNRAPWRTLS